MLTIIRVLGVPAHPFIVHGAVVFIPLATLAAAFYLLRPSARPAYWLLCTATVVIAEVFSYLSGMTGEQLEHALDRSRLIHQHAEWADRLGLAVHVLAATFLFTVLVDRLVIRGTTVPGWACGLRRVTAPVSLLAAVAAMALVGVVGHLGARAAWHNSKASSAAVRALKE